MLYQREYYGITRATVKALGLLEWTARRNVTKLYTRITELCYQVWIEEIFLIFSQIQKMAQAEGGTVRDRKD
jgi:hypothetical protein